MCVRDELSLSATAEQVKLSKVAAIMAGRKAVQKMKSKVAPVEGQFESAEEPDQKYGTAAA